ncbi:hypothetical protein CDAR_104821 [Caerostris darwini]|uniref:Uncharacterized protein n=1 Tax=Caerostris darwini TaxID=1538125 RepID=A0AAV4W3E2_9ARAC|nr:hypothetical protein CDAR_104821 [Caerostris darwini]
MVGRRRIVRNSLQDEINNKTPNPHCCRNKQKTNKEREKALPPSVQTSREIVVIPLSGGIIFKMKSTPRRPREMGAKKETENITNSSSAHHTRKLFVARNDAVSFHIFYFRLKEREA